MNRILSLIFSLLFGLAPEVGAEAKKVKVHIGVCTVLSGDLAILGQNIVATIETYKRHIARHDLQLSVEDGKISSTDGLKAYQTLIRGVGVDLLISACSSNATMAAKGLIHSAKIPTISVVTGGNNIDRAGRYIFRIGNSDSLNGVQEAEAFIADNIKNVALLTEETEYTQDIAKFFRPRFQELGGTLVFDQNFLPGTVDFRSAVSLMKRLTPSGVLMLTQTGTAFGQFIKQWREQGGGTEVQIHTSFVAAPNPDAHVVAGEAIYGTYYMQPRYDRESAVWRRFLEYYRQDHKKDPPIAFHSAGTIDTLALLENYLDTVTVAEPFDREAFVEFLLKVKEYDGAMGRFSFDEEGNASLGFEPARITRDKIESMK